MEIRLINYGDAGRVNHNLPAAEKKESEPIPVEDKVDFNNGINNPVEIAMLPAIDGALNSVLTVKNLINGNKPNNDYEVSGTVTTDNGRTKLADLKFDVNMSPQSTSIDGYFMADPEKQTGTSVIQNVFISQKTIHQRSS